MELSSVRYDKHSVCRVLIYFCPLSHRNMIKKCISTSQPNIDFILECMKLNQRGSPLSASLKNDDITIEIDLKEGRVIITRQYIAGKPFSCFFSQIDQMESIIGARHNLLSYIFDFYRIAIKEEVPLLLLTNDNLFYNSETGELLQNSTSLVGLSFLLEKVPKLSKKDFIQIYPLLLSETFSMPIHKRVSYINKMRSFLLSILGFILNKPIQLLKEEDIPEFLTEVQVEKLLRQHQILLKNCINTKGVIEKIHQVERKTNLNLYEPINAIIGQQQVMTWGQLLKMLFKNIYTPSNEKITNLCKEFAVKQWRQMNFRQRSHMVSRGIVSLSDPQKLLMKEDDYEMLAMVLLDVDFKDMASCRTLENYLSQQGFSAARRKIMLNIAKAHQKQTQTEYQFNFNATNKRDGEKYYPQSIQITSTQQENIMENPKDHCNYRSSLQETLNCQSFRYYPQSKQIAVSQPIQMSLFEKDYTSTVVAVKVPLAEREEILHAILDLAGSTLIEKVQAQDGNLSFAHHNFKSLAKYKRLLD